MATEVATKVKPKQLGVKPSLVYPVPEGSAKSNEVSETPGVSICSSTGIAICFFLPFMTWFMAGFTYSAHSLYFRENGWPLWHLAFVILISYCFRLRFNLWQASKGPWLAVPMCIISLLCGCQALASQALPWWLYDYSEAVVIAQLLGLYGCGHIDVAVQGLCFSTFSYDDKLLKKASRLLNLSVTAGYGTSPFIGGLLFDLGSWKLITIFHCLAVAVLLFIVCIQPSLRTSFKSWREKCNQAKKSVCTNTENIVPIVPEQNREEKANDSIWSRPEIARPAFLISLAYFCGVWSYMSEWMLYAIYFREQYGWEDAVWAGVAQMAGDLWGAGMLVLTQSLKKHGTGAELSTTSRGNPCKCIWVTLTSKPYHLSFILLCWVVCDVGICSPHFIVAVTAQVLMGTIWVFGYQWTVEMNIFLAAGDQDMYLKLQSLMANIMSAGCGASGPAALFLYEVFHPLAAFLISGVITFVAMMIYTTSFMCYPVSQTREAVIEEEVVEDNNVRAIHLSQNPDSDDDD